jgi:hypothetical protein
LLVARRQDRCRCHACPRLCSQGPLTPILPAGNATGTGHCAVEPAIGQVIALPPIVCPLPFLPDEAEQAASAGSSFLVFPVCYSLLSFRGPGSRPSARALARWGNLVTMVRSRLPTLCTSRNQHGPGPEAFLVHGLLLVSALPCPCMSLQLALFREWGTSALQGNWLPTLALTILCLTCPPLAVPHPPRGCLLPARFPRRRATAGHSHKPVSAASSLCKLIRPAARVLLDGTRIFDICHLPTLPQTEQHGEPAWHVRHGPHDGAVCIKCRQRQKERQSSDAADPISCSANTSQNIPGCVSARRGMHMVVSA